MLGDNLYYTTSLKFLWPLVNTCFYSLHLTLLFISAWKWNFSALLLVFLFLEVYCVTSPLFAQRFLFPFLSLILSWICAEMKPHLTELSMILLPHLSIWSSSNVNVSLLILWIDQLLNYSKWANYSMSQNGPITVHH